MWKDLSLEWQIAFEEAWAAFCNGSIPIGAALFDEDGTLIIRDRNRVGEKATVNKKISHAEANVLRRLDTDRYPNYRKMKLYTTMEPCPMCMGTIIMANIRDVSYASEDSYCGAVHLLEKDSFLRSKNTICRYIGGDHELFQITLQSYYEMTQIDQKGVSRHVLDDFEKSNARAVSIAEKLYQDHLLEKWSGNKEASDVFDAICGMKSEIE